MTYSMTISVATSILRLGRALTASLLLLACVGDDATTTEASVTTSASTSESTATATATTTTGEGTSEATSTTAGTASASVTTSEGTTTASTGTETDTGAPVGTCEDDEGCKLVNDCCACAALPSDAPVDRCPMDCLIGSCEAMGLHQATAACRLGVCAIAPQRCRPSDVVCDALPPECPEGQVASVVDGCWGACVPARLCDVLPVCTHGLCGAGWMCVESQAGAFAPHCEPIPAACEGTPACGCAGAAFGEVCLGGCEELGQSLLCADGG